MENYSDSTTTQSLAAKTNNITMKDEATQETTSGTGSTPQSSSTAAVYRVPNHASTKVEPATSNTTSGDSKVLVPPPASQSSEKAIMQSAANSPKSTTAAPHGSISFPVKQALKAPPTCSEGDLSPSRRQEPSEKVEKATSSQSASNIEDAALVRQQEENASNMVTTLNPGFESSSSSEESSSKKRVRSPIDGKELSLEKEALKKIRASDGSVVTTGASAKREESNEPGTAMEGTSPSESSDARNKRPASPLQQEKLSPKDPVNKKLRSLDSIAIATAAATPKMENNGGVFDDANEDETFEASIVTKEPPPSPPPASPSKSLRPDLIAAILGVPPKTSAASSRKPITTAAPQPKEVPAERPKPTKKKIPAKKVYTGKREQEAAERIVDGKVDLVKILPERDCRFLAEKMWIVTVQQLEMVINAKGGEELDFRNELINALMVSDFRNDDGHSRDSPETVSEKHSDSPANALKQPVKAEAHLVHPDSSAPSDRKDTANSVSAPDVSDPNHQKASERDCDHTPGGAVEVEVEVDDTLDGAVKAENDAVRGDVSSSTPGDLSVAGAGCKGPNISDQPVERRTPREEENQHISDSMPGETNEVEANSMDGPRSVPLDLKAAAPSDPPIEKSIPHEDAKREASDRSPRGMSREAAETILDSWYEKVQNRDQSNEPGGDKKQFLLDGPLSCLIPRCTLNFFASANIETTLDFMRLRRTETGLVVDMYAMWRKKCGLKHATTGTIAKHLLSVGMRLEIAIGSSSAPRKETREWFGGHAGILTGQAKDFLFDHCKIYDSSFVDLKTMRLADMLKEWRDSTGLPPLKGTGKVAMISSWKTLVKEAMDLEKEDGLVLPSEDLLKMVEHEPILSDSKTSSIISKKSMPEMPETSKKSMPEKPEPSKKSMPEKPEISKKSMPEKPETPGETKNPVELEKAPQTPIQPSKPVSPEAKAALESKQLLGEIFKKETTNVLASVGITTAQELLEADKGPKSQIVQAIIKMRKEFSGDSSGSIEPNSCVRLVYDWCRRVKVKVAEIDNLRLKQAGKSQAGQVQAKMAVEKTKPTANRDPYDALSDMARNFLGSVGVKDAESFLGAKTKYLADAFGKFREENDMPVLKGLGTVASISGWKAIVRKVAEESGQSRLVTLNAGRNTGKKLKKRRRKGDIGVDEPQPNPRENLQAVSQAKPQAKPQDKPQDKPQAKPQAKLQAKLQPSPRAPQDSSHEAHREVNIGGPKTQFCVGHGEDIFLFELSSRKCSYDKSKASPYLTYLGNTKTPVSTTTFENISLPEGHLDNDRALPVLVHVPKTSGLVASEKKPFSSEEIGLIDLGRYGIIQSSCKDESLDSIKRVLNSFIFGGNLNLNLDSSLPWNVFERLGGGVKNLFAYIAKPLEKGQTMELHFLPSTPQEFSGQALDEDQRKWIVNKVNTLQSNELRVLLDFLNDDVGSIVYAGVRKEFNTNGSGSLELQSDVKVVADLAIARRRMHWVALKIDSALQNELNMTILPNVAITPLWRKDTTAGMRKHPAWADRIRPLLISECRKEMMSEFKSDRFGGFYSSVEMWCPIADRLFRETIQLFATFNAELESFCSDERLAIDVAALVSEAVAKVQKCGEDRIHDQNIFADLYLRCKGDTSHRSNVFPTAEYLKARLNEGYRDGMALSGEPSFYQDDKDEFYFLATTAGTGSEGGRNEATPDFRSLEDARAIAAKLDTVWYLRAQILAVVESAVSCGVAHMAIDGPKKCQDIMTKIRDSAKKALGDKEITSFRLEMRTEKSGREKAAVPEALLSLTGPADCKPNAQPIFLGTVWPVLKRAKWKLEAGALPSSVAYFPPGNRKDNQSRMQKQEAAIERGKYARKTTELGLGYIPKQVKRMFVKCAAFDEEIDTRSPVVTVSEALRAFEQSFDNIGKPYTLDSTKKIVEHIAALFESVAPALLNKAETEHFTLEEGGQWKDTLHCDHLMRLLLVLPKMLNQSDVSRQQVENTSGVVAELINFLVENRQSMFAPSLQLPREEYEMKHEFSKFILSRLDKSKESSSANKPETKPMDANLKEIVLPSDRNDLTDFVNTVMDQLIACKATSDDLRSKGRRSFLTLGLPGLVCRHCLGTLGEGKYFYSNVASLSTAPTSVDKHIARCPMISKEVKARMSAARAIHSEQKGNGRPGAQTAFFSRLWDRLQLSRTSAGAEADMYITLDTAQTAPGLDQDAQPISLRSKDGTEFRSHVEVLEYIQSTSPWKSNPEATAAMQSYYSCLAWGGSIFNTTAMPPHFSSEWVLAKLCHKIDQTAEN